MKKAGAVYWRTKWALDQYLGGFITKQRQAIKQWNVLAHCKHLNDLCFCPLQMSYLQQIPSGRTPHNCHESYWAKSKLRGMRYCTTAADHKYRRNHFECPHHQGAQRSRPTSWCNHTGKLLRLESLPVPFSWQALHLHEALSGKRITRQQIHMLYSLANGLPLVGPEETFGDEWANNHGRQLCLRGRSRSGAWRGCWKCHTVTSHAGQITRRGLEAREYC